jgi:hypothetical protein
MGSGPSLGDAVVDLQNLSPLGGQGDPKGGETLAMGHGSSFGPLAMGKQVAQHGLELLTRHV